ncbi:MAG: hypothetical protein HZB76_05110, partial [Chlamydiae bacterium]|nr:hypothetical protein [Chlamydiota bacterium]
MGCFSPPSVGLSERGDTVFSKSTSLDDVRRNGGGKAANLAVLSAIQSANVPLWGFVSHSIFRKLFLSEDSEISRS